MSYMRTIFYPTLFEFAIGISVFFAIAQPVYAIKQYRCYGKVQYRPCKESDKSPSFQKKRTAEPTLTPVEATFNRVSVTRGLWDGNIQGNGDIGLALEFYRKGTLMERRFLGRTVIPDDATWFRFETTIPEDNQWEWRLLAFKREG